MSERLLRIRAMVGGNLAILLLLFAACVVGSGYLTYAGYVDTGTQVEEQPVSSWSSAAEFEHHAAVTGDTAAFANGTVLRNQDVYYRRLNPTLNGTFVFSYRASDGGALRGSIDVVLVHRSVSSRNDRSREYWRVERTVGGKRVSSLPPGEPTRVSFAANVTEAVRRAREIDQSVGGTPGEPEVLLEARLNLNGTRNGRAIGTNRTYQLPVRPADGIYRVDDPGTVTASGERTRQVAVPVDPGPIPRYGGPIALVLSLGGLGGLLGARRRGALTLAPDQEAWLEYRRERAEYDEWITTANLPAAAPSEPIVRVESLEGLVNLAIDTERRVLENHDSRWFAVLGEESTFVYVPPRVGEEGATVEDRPPEGVPGDGGNERQTGQPATLEGASSDTGLEVDA